MPRPPKTVIEYRKYELPLTFPAILLYGDRWHITDWQSNHLHFHNCLEFGICHKGNGTMIFDGQHIPFKEGDVTCIPRHIPHTTYSTKGTKSLWSYVFVNLNQIFFELLHNQSQDYVMPDADIFNRYYLMNRDECPKIHFYINSIVEELRDKKNNHQIMTKCLFFSLYTELIRIQDEKQKNTSGQSDTPPKGSLIIYPALDYINKAYMLQFSIDHLAVLCHLSTTHFRRVFLEIMGTSPKYFINSTRIDASCILLETTDKSILSISEMVGFQSLSSFNRYFTKLKNVSPRDYKNPEHKSDLDRCVVLEYGGWL